MHLPVFYQFFKFSPKTTEMLESNPRIGVRKSSRLFTMATGGGSRAEWLPSQTRVCKIPHGRELNPIPSAQPQNKEIYRPGLEIRMDVSQTESARFKQ